MQLNWELIKGSSVIRLIPTPHYWEMHHALRDLCFPSPVLYSSLVHSFLWPLMLTAEWLIGVNGTVYSNGDNKFALQIWG